jgi:uncharacterized protein
VKIQLLRISADGLELEETYDPKKWDMNRHDLEIIAPIKVAAVVHKDNDSLFVQVTVTTRFALECARCLKKFEIPVEEKFDLDYNIKGRTALDIAPDIRQGMILEYPINPLCSELCKGLCPACGKNLNDGKCKCNSRSDL